MLMGFIVLLFVIVNLLIMEMFVIGWLVMMVVFCVKVILVIIYFMYFCWEMSWKYVLMILVSFMSVLIVLIFVFDIMRCIEDYSI